MNDSPLLVDYRKGSVNLALYEPIRSLLTPCLDCSGEIGKLWTLNKSTQTYYYQDDGKSKTCTTCHDTGRTLSTLSSGDVSFYGCSRDGTVSIGIEVKEITELLSSLISGRLQDTQMRGMLNDYDDGHRWILHYGRYRPSPVDGSIQTWKEGHSQRRAGWYTFKPNNRPIPYGYLEAFKCCSAKEYGFDFVRVEDVIEAANWLGVLYRTWTRPYHTHKSMHVFDKSQDVRSKLRREQTEERMKSGQFVIAGSNHKVDNGRDKRVMEMADVFSRFPNIGYERAVAAAKHFYPSISAGVNASIEEWSNIEVITKGKIERVIRLGKENATAIKKFVS